MAGSRTARRWAFAGLLAVAGLVSSGCSWADWPRYGWPESASEQGQHLQYLWSVSFTAALGVGALVWGLMFWCFVVYRKRRNSPLYPKQTREHLPVEMVYTALPFLAITILFYFGTNAEVQALKLDPNPDVTVDVTAFKWGWDFAYVADENNDVHGAKVEGYDTPVLQKDFSGKEVHTTSTDDELPILMLPNGGTVEYVLSSEDVVHAFWVPAYDFKLDVFPSPRANNTKNHFQTTLIREGAWVGRCAELCGTYHATMNFEVRSVPPKIFDAYVDLRAAENPETGKAYSAAEALTKLGEQFPECGELCAPTTITTYPLETERTERAPAEPGPNVRGLK